MFTVLIDGPSGAGKTSYAEALSRHTGFSVVHLEDFYPGWGGLAQAAVMVTEDVLHPSSPGFRRWDWEQNQAADWVALDPRENLIIEGVGAITEASVAAAKRRGQVLTVRINAPVSIRRRRALIRDPNYEPWWNMWAAQEAEFFADNGRISINVSVI
ncbi:hypothetical protein C5L39_08240 [Corynebacterium alimapuense]|uniref:(d)CMP kinase n=1 Tax=Corynebacterium alimapuense TaxID=1576874 RepID=A0A3M8K7Z5_9CORY|nr:hypothetical protein C5L39_08240 [Corynebacterium alimapuense]